LPLDHDGRINAAIGLLTRLVAFDSVSRHSNLPLIAFIEDYLTQLQIPCMRAPSPDGSKSNLLARIGPDVAGGTVFSGHTDVVPVDGQQWLSDPFTVQERDGKLYGRGTADMKGFLAVCLALVPEFKAMPLKKPIWLAFSYDEEVGCLGAPHLLNYIDAHIPKPALAIIGEPTLMQVVTAHKGVLSFETTVHGLEAHSSQPQLGVNAVHIACELVNWLSKLAQQMAQSGKRDARFTPQHSTVHVGIIHGGTARNIIAKECVFQWEIRPLPGEDTDALVAQFEAQCDVLRRSMPGGGIEMRPMSRMLAVTLPESAHASCQKTMRCAQTNTEHAVSFGTEAGVFNDHGIPAIICGPGNIAQAHKPDEFIERSEIGKCIAFLLRMTVDADT
jgi:acetylornithine deacetylase